MADKYQLEDGSGAYLLEDGSGALLLEASTSIEVGVPILLSDGPDRIRPLYFQSRSGPDGPPPAAAPPPTDVYGWWPQVSVPVRRGASLALLTAGLVLVPTPPPAHANGWQAPLSTAPRTRAAIHTQPTFVHVPPASPQGWQGAFSKAPQVTRRPIDAAGFVPFNTLQRNTENGWQAPLSVAPKTSQPVHTPPVWVPQEIAAAAAVTVVGGGASSLTLTFPHRVYYQGLVNPLRPPDVVTTVEGWQGTLSKAPQAAKPFHTQPTFVVPAAAAPQGWQSSLSVPRTGTKRPPDAASFVPFDTRQRNTEEGWQAALSVAPAARKPIHTTPIYVTREYVVAAAAAVEGWQLPLGTAPARRLLNTKVADLRPFSIPEPEGFTLVEGWQAPLSRAPHARKPIHTPGFVPLDTRQRNTENGWQQALSTPPRRPVPVHTQPIYVTQEYAVVVTAHAEGWQTSTSVHTPPRASTPVHTQPTFVVPAAPLATGWQQALSTAPSRALQSFPPAAVLAPFVATARGDGWQAQLSLPPSPVQVAPQGGAAAYTSQFFVNADNNVGIGNWLVPLSIAAQPTRQAAPVGAGWGLVPFDTVQVPPVVSDELHDHPVFATMGKLLTIR